jgi:hypothetical protein
MRLVVLMVIALAVGVGYADNYEVSVTRKESNLYKIDTMNIYIQTRFCYEYVYFQDAVLMMSGRTGELVFSGRSRARCDVVGVYGDADLDSGNYAVTVSRKEGNWYEVFGTDIFILTSLCLELALMDNATLRMSFGGRGTLVFSNNRSCTVEGVYSGLRL